MQRTQRTWVGRLAAAVGLAAVSLAAAENGTERRFPPGRSGTKRIVGWIEVNAPDKRVVDLFPDLPGADRLGLLREHGIEAMKVWASVCETFVVSTRPGATQQVYPQFMRAKPEGLRLIGGLKTYTLPGASPGDRRAYDFADEAGWLEIARESMEIARITGVSIVVLENETALRPFHTGQATIDYVKLKRALEPLRRTGIEFWWNQPRILEDIRENPNRERETTACVKAIHEALPNAVFLTEFTGWRDWEASPNGEAQRRRAMTELVGQKRMQERLYVTQDGWWHKTATEKLKWRCYTPDEALEALKRLPGPEVNFYPDSYSWMSVPRQLAKLMEPSEKE